MQINGLVLKESFESWGKCSRDSKIFKKLSTPVKQIAYQAFDEMIQIKPGYYEVWWATNHNRFIRKVTQRELSLLHEIMYHFLTDLIRGKLVDVAEKKIEKRKVEKEVRKKVSKETSNEKKVEGWDRHLIDRL